MDHDHANAQCDCEMCVKLRMPKTDALKEAHRQILRETIGRVMQQLGMHTSEGLMALVESIGFILVYGCKDEKQFRDRVFSFVEDILFPWCAMSAPGLLERSKKFETNTDDVVNKLINKDNSRVTVRITHIDDETGLPIPSMTRH